MTKTLLSSAIAALMLGSAVNAQAETAYALMSGYPTWSVCSYDFDKLGSVQADKLFSVPFGNVQAAASVGDYYYTYATVVDQATYDDILVFASINMETQETSIIREFGSVYGENGFEIRDLASDGTDLYGLKANNYWDEDTDAMVYSTDVVKVNVADGSFEAVKNVPGTCWGLTIQNGEFQVVMQGALSGWSYLIDLYKIGDDNSLTALTNNTEVTTNESMPMHSVAAPDGTVYFFSSSSPYKMVDGVTKFDNVTAYQSYTGTTFTPSTKLAAAGGQGGTDVDAPATRVLVCTSTFGDYMGTSPIDKCTAQKQYYYDANMRIVAVINTATNAYETDQITQHYQAYRYDAEGNLTAIDAFQYGLYDLGDRSMVPSAGSVIYKYDELGNLVEEIADNNSTTYEYDADGNVIKEVRYSYNFYTGSAKEGKTIIYSDYVAKGKPGKAVSTHTDETLTGEFYEETYTYDDQLRLVKTYRECNVDKVVKVGSFSTIELISGTFMQQENWTYEGNELMLYEKFNSIDEETGMLIPYLKTVYTKVSDNVIGHQSYTAFWMPGAETEWYKTGTYQEDTYVDFAGMTDITAIDLLSVQKGNEGINTALVEFTVPQIAYFNTNVSFNIYRNGEFIRTLALMDSFDEDSDLTINEETGNLVFIDRDLYNGNYEYFVQTAIMTGGNGGGIEPLDDDIDDGFGIDPITYEMYCSSNIASAEIMTELPAVTDVRAISSEKDANDDNYVTIAFTPAVGAAEYGFISNSLMVNHAQVAEDVTRDAQASEMHCTLFNDIANIYVVTRYKYGKAYSDMVVVDVNNIINSVEQLRELATGDMMVFDMSGRQVNAPVESLHGSYIVVIGQTARKVVLQ